MVNGIEKITIFALSPSVLCNPKTKRRFWNLGSKEHTAFSANHIKYPYGIEKATTIALSPSVLCNPKTKRRFWNLGSKEHFLVLFVAQDKKYV